MYLPADLQQAIAAGLGGMRRHPGHALMPFRRQAIYEVFNRDAQAGRLIRQRLAILAAERVYLIWVEYRPEDPLVGQVLAAANALLNDSMATEDAKQLAEDAWEHLEELADRQKYPGIGAAWCAGEAARIALEEALGHDPFEDSEFDEYAINEALEAWYSDAPRWAAGAYAGREGDPESSPVKRLEFWEWWLNEAVPEAWRSAR